MTAYRKISRRGSSSGGARGLRLPSPPAEFKNINPLDLSRYLTGDDIAKLRLTHREKLLPFRATCETFLAQRFNIEFNASTGSMRQFLEANQGFDIWAAGSSMVQVWKNTPQPGAILMDLERQIYINDPAWSESDLDLYTNGNPHEENGPLFTLIKSWGYTFHHKFGEDYTSGFMHRNKISTITSFKRVSGGVERQIQVIELKPRHGGRRPIELTIDSFDLTCCSVGYNFRTKEFYVSDDAIDDITNDRMRLRESYIAKFSMANFILHKRVLKYKQRGFVFLNPPPLTLAIQKVDRSLRRLAMKIQTIQDLIDALPVLRAQFNKNGYPFYEENLGRANEDDQQRLMRNTDPNNHYAPFQIQIDRGLFKRTRFGNVTPRSYYDLTIRRLEFVVEKLEFLKRVYESGDIREILATNRVDAMKKEVEIYRRENIEIREEIRQGAEIFGRKVTEKRNELLFNVPVNAQYNQNDRLRLHNFERDARVYQGAILRARVCEPGPEPYTREIIPDDIPDTSRLFKRAVYLPRVPPRAAAADPNVSDDDSEANVRFLARCYDLPSLTRDILNKEGQGVEPIYPDDRVELTDYEIILVKHLDTKNVNEQRIQIRQEKIQKLLQKIDTHTMIGNRGAGTREAYGLTPIIDQLSVNERLQIFAGGKSKTDKSNSKRSVSKKTSSKKFNSKAKKSKTKRSKKSKAKSHKSPRRKSTR